MVMTNVVESHVADNCICLRELAAFGKYSSSFDEEGSFRLSKHSSKPRNVTLQFDAAGTSWGLKGLSTASNKRGKINPSGNSHFAGYENIVANAPPPVHSRLNLCMLALQGSSLHISMLPTRCSQHGLGLLQKAPEAKSKSMNERFQLGRTLSGRGGEVSELSFLCRA